MTDPIAFDWHQFRGEQRADLLHDGVRVIVTATQARHAKDPCSPAACHARAKSLVRVSVTAYADNDLRLAEADALVHARLCRPAGTARPWSEGCGRPSEVPDARAIADCAADQIADATADARLALAALAGQAARIGVTACRSCSRGEGGGGYPCDCPAACGARYCQHPLRDRQGELVHDSQP